MNEKEYTLTKKKTQSTKVFMIVLASLAILLNMFLFIILLVIGAPMSTTIFPILLFAVDIIYLLAVINTNFRMKYSISLNVLYLIVFILFSFLEIINLVNKYTIFTNIALIAWILSHTILILSVIVLSILARKRSIVSYVFDSLVTLVAVSLCVFNIYSVINKGYFGQGFKNRAIKYEYDSLTDTYTAVGLLKGNGKIVEIPNTFNDIKVGSIDSSILCDKKVEEVHIFTDEINFINENKLTGVNEKVKIYATKDNVEDLRNELYSNGYDNNSETLFNICENIKVSNIEDDEVYINYLYTKEAYEIFNKEILPISYLKTNETFNVDTLSLDTTQHTDRTSISDLDWCVTNSKSYMFDGIYDSLNNNINNTKITSNVNAKLVFSKIYKIYLSEDNDLKYEISDNYRKSGNHDFLYAFSDEINDYYSNIKRSGFNISYINEDTNKTITNISEELKNSNGTLNIKPIWELIAPSVVMNNQNTNYVYGDNILLSGSYSSQVEGIKAIEKWYYEEELVSESANYNIEVAKPPSSGKYTYDVLIGNDEITSLTAHSAIYKNINIAKKTINVVWETDTLTYNGYDQNISAHFNEDDIVNNDIPTLGLSITSVKDANNYLIEASTDALYYEINSENISHNVLVNPYSISVTANSLSKVYGEDDPILTYNSFSLLGSDTLITGTLKREVGQDVGTYNIGIGDLSAGTNYRLSISGNPTLTITKKEINVQANSINTTYGEEKALTYTSDSLCYDDTFRGSLSREAGVNVGIYKINIGTLVLSNNYSINYTGADYIISRKTINVQANTINAIYGTDQALTYTSDSLCYTDTFSGSLARNPGKDVGTYVITQGTLELSDNYTLDFTGANYIINKKTIRVVADSKTVTYGDSEQALTYTSNSLCYSDTFSGSLTREPGLTSGTYAITQGTLELSDNYTLDFTGSNYIINKKLIKVQADSKTITYGDSEQALTYMSDDLCYSDLFSGVLSREPGINAGTYKITQGTLELSDNYTLDFTGANYIINKKTIRVVADSKTVTYGDSEQALTYTADSLCYTDTFTGALTRKEGANVGTYKITQGTLSAGNNYVINFTGANYVINPKNIVVSTINYEKVYGDSDPTILVLVDGESSNIAYTGTLGRETGEDAKVYNILKGTIDFGTNYNVTYDLGTLTINKKEISGTWQNLSFTANETHQSPEFIPSIDISLTYEYYDNTDTLVLETKNPGTYKVIVKSINNNYTILNNETTYTIEAGE